MFADPQSITISGTAYSLAKINQDNYSSEFLYRASDKEVRVKIRNTSFTDKKVGQSFDRHNVEVVMTVFANGLAPAYRRKTYFVVENQVGDTLTDPISTAAGLFTWATAATNANLTKLINSES